MKIHKRQFYLLFFYGRETLSLTLGKRIGGVFENRMLKIFGLKGEELAADSKTTAYCEAAWFVFYTKHYWGEQIMENEMDRACGNYRGVKCAIQDFGGETSRRKKPCKT